jgi:hypothetical protein
MRSLKTSIVSVAIVALLLAVATAGATTYALIKPGSVDHTKLSTGLNNERTSNLKRLTALETKKIPNVANSTNASAITGPKGATGDTGAKGEKGDKGATGETGDAVMTGAYYAVAYYDVGDTNGGAIATVACKTENETAVSGGTSTDDYTKTVPVGQSFPGRMDWSTNTPKPMRLDGWVVQFASQNSDAPERVKVWALCVPGLSIVKSTEYTYTESD